MRRRISPFAYLNATQFLGALNDNIFKWVMIFFLLDILGVEKRSEILSLAGAIYVLPFLLFSLAAGTFADRLSKSRIIVFTKVLEIGVMGLALYAFFAQSVFLAYFSLFCMSIQSALFSPSKYGIVPELVPADHLARANGLLAAFTVFSIIAGTLLASLFTNLTHRNFPLVALFCIGIAIAGTLTSLGIHRTLPVGSHRPLSFFPFKEVWTVLKRARGESYLLEALFGAALFFFVGAYMQLSVVPLAMDALGLTDTQGGYLFFCSSLGIAIGAVGSGKICGRFIELGIAPIAGGGIAVTMFLLSLFATHLPLVILFIFLMGIFAGLFLVPFESFIQAASPDLHRGQNLAAGNFLVFSAILAASGLFALLSFLTPQHGLLVVSIFCALFSLVYAVRLSDTFIRLIGRWQGRGGALPVENGETIRSPRLLICRTESRWGALPLISASEQRYTRFLIERCETFSESRGGWIGWLAKHRFYDGATIQEGIEEGRRWVRRGYNVAILPNRNGGESSEQLLDELSNEIALERKTAIEPLLLKDVSTLELSF